MYAKLSGYQLKRDCYKCKMFYVNLIVTTKKKTFRRYTKDTKEIKDFYKKNHITKEDSKRERKELQNRKQRTKWQW